MGHWERYLPIAHLAEAAGIRDAIVAFDFSIYEGPCSVFGGDLSYVCAVRGKHARDDGQTPFGPVGQLYACIYGDKYIVGGIYGHSLDCLGPDSYSTYFEDIDPNLVEEAKRECPSLCTAAQERMRVVLEHVVIGSKVSNIRSRAEGLELRPKIAKFLLMHGPATCDECLRGINTWRYCIDRYGVFDELVKEGFLNREYNVDHYVYSLAEGASQMLDDYEPLEIPATPEGKLVAVLGEKGPLSSENIAFEIGSSVRRVRAMLRKLANEGVVEAKGRGLSRRYSLAHVVD